MNCVPEMTENSWPGFYMAYRYHKFLKSNNVEDVMQFQK